MAVKENGSDEGSLAVLRRGLVWENDAGNGATGCCCERCESMGLVCAAVAWELAPVKKGIGGWGRRPPPASTGRLLSECVAVSIKKLLRPGGRTVSGFTCGSRSHSSTCLIACFISSACLDSALQRSAP